MTTLADILSRVAEAVTADEEEFNRLDSFAGDGDLGLTITAAARAVAEAVTRANDPELATLLRTCASEVADRAPSTCGTLIATGFLGAARAAEGRSTENAVGLLAALTEAALQSIQERGRAELGDKTLLDALAPAVESLKAAAKDDETVAQALSAAASAAASGAGATAALTPHAGRARWMSERSRGHKDGGAHLIELAFGAAAQALAVHQAHPASPASPRQAVTASVPTPGRGGRR